MPLNSEELVRAVKLIAEQKGLNATFKGVLKGTGIVAACTAGGGLFGGPWGLTVGGVIGALIAGVQMNGQFRSVAEIIMEDMTDAQRAELARSVENIFRQIDAQDVITAVAVVAKSQSLEALVLNEVGNYLKSEMGYSICSM